MNVFILSRAVHGEKFWKLSTLSAEEGVMVFLMRQATKKTGTIAPDIFDEAELVPDRKKAGSDAPPFAKEYVLLRRHTGIARDYSGLVYAARFAGILEKNAFPPDARGAVFSLCHTAIEAFSEKPRKETAYFKALWLLAKTSGLPVREDWFRALAFSEKTTVAQILRSPLEALPVPANEVEYLVGRLEFWLSREQDFSLD